ncbi:MAG: hypothetical protein ACXVLQ_12570 [Bacteriovorax sp.]
MKWMKNISLTLFFSLGLAQAASAYTCTKTEINTIYIPILREVVDWPDDMIRPYAKQLCLLTKEKAALQKSISKRSEELRTGNWRICKEVIPGNPNPSDSECKSAYDAKVNGLIDQCIGLVSLGHNPHNVMLFIDPLQVEVACLRGTNISLK